MLTTFGAAALLFALLGIYGVLAYTVSLRVQEFGIRIALGSGKSALVSLAMAFFALRWVSSLLYQTPVNGPNRLRRQRGSARGCSGFGSIDLMRALRME